MHSSASLKLNYVSIKQIVELLVTFVSYKKKSLWRINFRFWWLLDKNKITKIGSCITVLNLERMWRAHYSYLISRSWLGIIMNLHFYKYKYFVNYFLETIESIIIFFTQSINVLCSWHWTSSQFSSLILIVLRHYFTKVK